MEKRNYKTDKDVDAQLLVDELKELTEDDCIIRDHMLATDIIVLEKFYFRNSSFASCTICMEHQEDGTQIVVVCSGAGQGILNMAWGATESFMNKVEQIIQKFL